MSNRTLLGRLFSPAGFGAVLLLFFLPFVTVSCGDPAGQATYTGLDMVTGTPPTIVLDDGGEPVDEESAQWLLRMANEAGDLEPFMLLAALAAFLGMAGGLVRERLARHAIGAGLAAVTAALLGGGMLRVPGRLDRALEKNTALLGEPLPSAEITIHPAFWLTLALLGTLMVGHVAALVVAWRRPTTAPVDDEPDYRLAPLARPDTPEILDSRGWREPGPDLH